MSAWRYRRILRSPVLAALLLNAAPAFEVVRADPHGQAAGTVALDIKAQPIGDALNEFARQVGLQVVLFADVGAGVTTPRVSGVYAPQEALKLLLAHTGLYFEYVNARTIAVRASNADTAAGDPGASGSMNGATAGESAAGLGRDSSAGQLRLARSEQNDRGGEAQTAAVSEESEVDGKGTPEMLVKGRRTLNTDIQRTENDMQPYVVFDREQLEHAMSTNLEDFLKTRLPMNTVQQTNSQNASAIRGNQSSINLRGLGDNQTLILVNGRRMPSINTLGAFGQPDISAIPLSAVERIEVLPSTASGIYGGGATGGVINIITRQDYSGIELRVDYGNSFDADATTRRIDGNAGFSLFDGRTQVLLAASHAESNPLLTAERDFVGRARSLQLANNPGAFHDAATPPLGYTSNIRSVDGSNLQLKMQFGSTQLNSPFTHVPVGYAGAAADNAAALAANAGRYNLDLQDAINGGQRSLLSSPTVESATASLRHAFGESVEVFVDGVWLENRGRSFAADPPNVVTLQPEATNNPFTTAIRVRFPATGLELLSKSDSETVRAAAGIIARLPRDWTAAAEHNWNRSRTLFELTDPILASSANGALANGTLDVMRDLNAFPLNYMPYLLPPDGFVLGPATTTLQNTTLRLSGPVFELPGGPLMLSSLIERRKEETDTTFLKQTFGAFVFYDVTPQRDQTIDSYYLELRAPLIAPDGTSGRSLELQASVRHDNYASRASNPPSVTLFARDEPLPPLDYTTNEVSATKYTLGLGFSPTEDLMLRASVGTGFLPPSIGQIVPFAPLTFSTDLVDMKRENVLSTVGPATFTFGGNINLRPEDSESWSVGAVFTPHRLPGLRLSVDYSRIEKTDEITMLTAQQILDLEDALPGRVTRDMLTPEDAALNYTGGEITAIDQSAVNIAAARLEAFDLQADYAWRSALGGDVRVYAIFTWQPDFERQAVSGAAFVNSVGFSNGQLEWRGNAGIDWTREAWTFGWNTQYYDAYFVYSAGSSAATIAAAMLNQGSDTIPSQTYHDLFVRYRFDDAGFVNRWLAGLQVSAGIHNLFNEIPPILASTASTNGYSTYGDPRLRRYVINVVKRF
jgi:outer membrane receptor protein involved in Fe transport